MFGYEPTPHTVAAHWRKLRVNRIFTADKIQVPLIVRGLINHSFQDTQTKLEIAPGYKNGIVMDPRLFEAYQITAVPLWWFAIHPCLLGLTQKAACIYTHTMCVCRCQSRLRLTNDR